MSEIINFEGLLIRLLLQNKMVREKVLPYLTPNLFDSFEHKEIIKDIISFERQYNKFPTIADLKIKSNNKEVFNRLLEILAIDIGEYSEESLIGEIETFLRKKLVFNVVTDIVSQLKENNITKLPSFVDNFRDATSFSFNNNIGISVFEEAERLYNFFHNRDIHIKSGLNGLDRWIEGGFHEKTLSIFMGQVNLGKSLVLCSIASNCILQNKNVLYITLEMSEEKVSERILQNYWNMTKEQIKSLDKQTFLTKLKYVNDKLKSKFMVKEFPTKGANVNHFRHIIKELENKKKFISDIIFVDYIGIMKSVSPSRNDNTYTEVKRISEELRGLAVELGKPILSAVQVNREGFGSAEIDMTNISDSIGTAATADIIIGITQPEEFLQNNKYLFIILKNRYGPNGIKLPVCVEKEKMKIYDDEEYIKKLNGETPNKTNAVVNKTEYVPISPQQVPTFTSANDSESPVGNVNEWAEHIKNKIMENSTRKISDEIQEKVDSSIKIIQSAILKNKKDKQNNIIKFE